jgi:protein Mpv17
MLDIDERDRYQAKLKAQPLLTQAVMSAVSLGMEFGIRRIQADERKVLFGAGDTLAQQAVEKKGFKNQDLTRTARMAGYGGRKY